ncbi:MAG: 60S ribosomal protein L31 [Hadesarchaea archaeon]|nr:60S ribosomal protein L31 [Hadesarchaea archaeon]
MPDEQVYTIPLSDRRKAHKNKRASRAINMIKEFLENHMNTEEVKIDIDLNEKIWRNSASNPPSKIRVRALKRDDGVVEAYLAE